MYENQQRYMAVALANKLNVASTGTASVQIKFGTVYNMADPNTPVKKILWGSLYLTDDTFEKSLDTLSKVFGFNSTDISEINNNTELFSGVEVILVTDMDEYNGQVREKVKFINSPNGGVGKKLDDIASSELSIKLENKLKAYYMRNKIEAGTQTRKPPTPQRGNQFQSSFNGYSGNDDAPPPNDDDLPF